MKQNNLEYTDEKTVYAVWTNTDLTEGRGSQYIKTLCYNRYTARRMAHGVDVQGTDGRVSEEKMFYFPKLGWYAPVQSVFPATDADLLAEKIDQENKAKDILVDKFKKGEELTEVERETILKMLGKN